MKTLILCTYLLITPSVWANENHEPFGWQKVKGAKLYLGTVKESSIGPYRFGTNETKVLLPGSPKAVFIKAFGLKGKNLGHQYAKRIEGEVKGIATPPAPVEKITLEEAENDEAEPDVDMDESFFSSQALPVNNAPIRVTSVKHLFINLGMGSESLDVKGGISSFKSDTTIGSTHMHFDWAHLKRKSRTYGVSLDAAAHIHNATVEEQTDSTGSDTQETEHHYFRSSLSLLARYYLDHFIKSTTQQASIGLGLSSYRTPLMSISDNVSGKSRAKMKTIYGPALGADYRYIFNAKHKAGVDVQYLVLGLGDVKKASRLDVGPYYTFMFDAYKGVNAALDYTQEATTKGLSCPAVTNCKAQATTTSSSIKYMIGLDMNL